MIAQVKAEKDYIYCNYASVSDPVKCANVPCASTATSPNCVCQVGADCDDGIACTTDVCNAGSCVNTPSSPGCFCSEVYTNKAACTNDPDCAWSGSPANGSCGPAGGGGGGGCGQKNDSCSTGTDCCSNTCKPNGRCA
jgi:hypothetical protein